MNNKTLIYDLKNDDDKNHTHCGVYFEIKFFLNKYYLFYWSNNKLKLVISNTLFFEGKPITILNNIPGCVFTILQENNGLFILCGCHNSNKEQNEILIPDLVWPNEKKTILDWKVSRIDRKNGMYLLFSKDGKSWKNISEKPVLHRYISSSTCKLGEVAFDTHPCLIKHNNTYIYFGRLNSSLDERRLYIRKSNDLLNWSLPEKINILNENKNNLKKNYYNLVVFNYNNIFYGFSQYFEACGTENRNCSNGCTLLLKSENLLDWTIINSYLFHKDKYKDRIEGVIFEDENTLRVFFRENCNSAINQNLISYLFSLNDL